MIKHFSKALFGFLALGLLASCAKQSGGSGTDSTGANGGNVAASVEHGRYLVKTVGCGDCHTPWTMGPQGPMQDTTKMLSGHPAGMMLPPAPLPHPWMAAIDMSFTAFSGPWGISYAANLTPDSATGLGGWSQQQFMQALRTGKHLGNGRPIMPPMPWPAFSNMTDNDLASIYMYLRTIPAISNNVPDAQVNQMPPGAGGPPPGMSGAPGEPPHPPANPTAPLPPGAMQPAMPPGAPKKK